MKRTPSGGLGSIATGGVTAAALAVQTGLAAVVGVIIAREFGRGEQTDGFFAAYAVFIVLALAATAARLVVLPTLARARQTGSLAAETRSFALALIALALPFLAVGSLLASPVAALVTGFGPADARSAAAEVLPWMMLAGVAQLFAGLGASALAALDDYVTAAAGYIVGSVCGLAVILGLIDGHGIAAVSWGMAVNGGIAVAIPAVALARRLPREATSRGPAGEGPLRRLGEVARGTSFPLALQAVYLITVPFAAHRGVGAVTVLGYAYLAGSAVVSVTASSLGLATSAPLARQVHDPGLLARHIVASSWPAMLASGAAAGVFVVAGEQLVSRVLGPSYRASVGTELGRLVAELTPWMALTIAVSVALPLMFVAGLAGRLPALAVLMTAVHVPLAWAGEATAGLVGLAAALALSTATGLAGLLLALGVLRPVALGVGASAAVVAATAAAAFGAAGLVTGGFGAALLGLALYVALLAAVRPAGLRASVRHLRRLE